MLLFVASLVCVCGSATVSGEPAAETLSTCFGNPDSTTAYADGWDAARHFDFQYATECGWTEAHPDFAEGVKAALDGRFDAAESAFTRVLSTSQDATELEYARKALYESLLAQSKWKSLVDSDPNAAGASGAAPLARVYGAATPETVTFPEYPVKLAAKFNMTGNPEVHVITNGVPRWFIIDTGAGLTVLASDFAETCGVNPEGHETTEAGTATSATVSTRPAVINEMRVGDVVFRNHPCIIIDKKDLDFKLLGLFRILKIDGIIGWNAIRLFDLTIDYGNRRVEIRKPFPANNIEKNFFWLGYPIVKLGSPSSDCPLYFGLDTGASETSVSSPLFAKISVPDSKEKKVTVRGAGGKPETRVVRIVPKLSIALNGQNLTLEDVPCNNRNYGPFFVLDGILGSDAVKDGIMHLDLANGLFELIPPEE